MKTISLALLLVGVLSLSGCIAGSDDDPSAPVDREDPLPVIMGPFLETFTGTSGNAISTPLFSITNGGTYEFPLTRNGTNVSGYVLELTWDPIGPESDSLDLWIRATGDYAIPPSDPMTLVNSQPTLKATGGSPLRLAFTPDALQPEIAYSILVRAATPAGVSLEQPFALQVAVFDGLAFDEAYAFAAP